MMRTEEAVSGVLMAELSSALDSRSEATAVKMPFLGYQKDLAWCLVSHML